MLLKKEIFFPPSINFFGSFIILFENTFDSKICIYMISVYVVTYLNLYLDHLLSVNLFACLVKYLRGHTGLKAHPNQSVCSSSYLPFRNECLFSSSFIFQTVIFSLCPLKFFSSPIFPFGQGFLSHPPQSDSCGQQAAGLYCYLGF